MHLIRCLGYQMTVGAGGRALSLERLRVLALHRQRFEALALQAKGPGEFTKKELGELRALTRPPALVLLVVKCASVLVGREKAAVIGYRHDYKFYPGDRKL